MAESFLGLSVTFMIFPIILLFLTQLRQVNSAIHLQVTSKCFRDRALLSQVPMCHVEVDLVRRQKCVEDVGTFLVLDSQANEATIHCQSAYPIKVELLAGGESFFPYPREEFVVINGRNTSDLKNTAGAHTVRIPILPHEIHDNNTSGERPQFREFTTRKYIIGGTDPNQPSGTTSAGKIHIVVLDEGSSVIFNFGPKKPRLTSDIAYIPCIYDFTHGIRVHQLKDDESDKSLDVRPDTYNPIFGFKFNISETAKLYGNNNYYCYGEGSATNQFIIGPAVYELGYGLQYHEGVLAEPSVRVIECYTPPCTVHCEFNEPIFLKITPTDTQMQVSTIDGHFLFRSFENATRYAAGYSADSKTFKAGDKIQVDCISTRDEVVLHTWEILSTDIRRPVVRQTLQIRMSDHKRASNRLAVVQCVTTNNSISIKSLVNLGCSNPVECEHYMYCVNNEDAALEWASRYLNPRSCSPPLTKSKPCATTKNGNDCQEIELDQNGLIMCSAENNISYQAPYFFGFDQQLYLNPELMDIPPDGVVTISMRHSGEIFSRGWFEFICESHHFYTEHGLKWILKWKNGSRSEPLISDNFETKTTALWNSAIDPFRKSRIQIESTDIASVICAAPLIHSNNWIENDFPLDIKESVIPTITVPNRVNFDSNSPSSIVCVADGYPPPNVTWIVPSEVEDMMTNTEKGPTVTSMGHTATLTFPKFTEVLAGDYFCLTFNEVYNVTRKVSVGVKSSNGWIGIVVGVSLTVLLILALAFLYLFRRWKQTYETLQKISDAELDEFLNGMSGGTANEDYRFVLPALALPYNTTFEVDLKNLDIDKTSFLGSGQFGVVYKGSLTSLSESSPKSTSAVAVKTLKGSCSREELVNLLNEIKLMIYLGSHPNLVQLLGASTKNCRTGEVYLVMEFCSLGSLQKYLETNRDFVSEDHARTNDDLYTNTSSVFPNLFQWSYEIACGMEFIASKNMIHGDLAIRNVLLQKVGTKGVAKVGDFGLSRKLYEYSQYVKTKQEPLPWRWLALESIRQLKFNEKSDVWSYGVTLWEIFSLGDLPFPGFSYNLEFLNMIENGMRNSKPQHASDTLCVHNENYELMQRCWRNDPSERPTFTEIRVFLEAEFKSKIIPISGGYTSIDNNMAYQNCIKPKI